MNRRSVITAGAIAAASMAISPIAMAAGNGEQKQDGSGGNCDMTCIPYLPSPGTIVDKSLLIEDKLKQIEIGMTAREMIDFVGCSPSFIRKMPNAGKNCVSYIFELNDGKVVYDSFDFDVALYIFDIDLVSQKVVYCMNVPPLM